MQRPSPRPPRILIPYDIATWQRRGLCVSIAFWLIWATAGWAEDAANTVEARQAVAEARALMDQGRHQEALPLFRQTLDVLATQQPSTTQASLINETAVVYFHLGRLQESEELYRQAILIYRTTDPLDRAGLATSLNNLAALHHRQRDFESAEPLYQQALELRREVLGADHPNVAFSLNELAMLYHSQRRLEEAAELYSQSLAIEEKLLGQDAAQLAPRLTNLAVIYRLQGLFNRAEPLFRRALTIQRQHLGERHPDVAVAINNLAVLYSVMGRFDEAEALYQQAMTLQQTIFGERHISIAMGLRNLAILYDRQGDVARTRDTLGDISAILQENCGASQTAALSSDDRAVCDNALATQQQLLNTLGIDLDSEPGINAPRAATRRAATPPDAAPTAQPKSTATLTRPAPQTSQAKLTAEPQRQRHSPSTDDVPPPSVFRAQVRSHQEKDRAEGDLNGLSQTHAAVLNGIQGHIQRVDLGPKGIWFRVQFGDFSSSIGARQLCRELNYDGLESCWVAETPGL